MARSPTESKIPILHTNPLKNRISRPLSTLSSRLRAHLDGDHRSSVSSALLGFLGATSSNLKNVNIGKVIDISHLNKIQDAASQDDLKSTTQPITRPTNLFTSEHFFPSLVAPSQQQQHHHHHQCSITGVENVGRRVRLNSGKEGVLRFVGKTQFGEGIWCGVELDKEEGGTSDGTVNNVRYFTCPKNRAVFVLLQNVALVSEEVCEYLSDVSDSGPHSLLGITGGDVDHVQNEPAEKPTSSETLYFGKANTRRCTSCNLQQTSQTPTPNSSNSGHAVSYEWKSSASSLVLSYRGALPSSLDPSSVQMSKHSSFECDESLGILTPDQMAELTTYSGGGGGGGGSCDDFCSLVYHHERVCEPYKMVDFKLADCKKPKCPSMDNIVIPECTTDCFVEMIPEVAQNELLDRLFSETDTCIMSSSSLSEHMEFSKDVTLRTSSVEELQEADDLLSTTLMAPEQIDTVEMPVAAPATSFVTSVTSIGSWDNGYQGDGECSRPTSRGADALPLSRSKLVNKVLEPMTDSDFYTESDADLYEDVSSCLRRDRKARIIDGKLFGSPVNIKLTTNQSYSTQILSAELYGAVQTVPEEMDSSGIYSDFEKKSDAPEKAVEEINDVQMLLEESHLDASAKSPPSVSSQEEISREAKEMVKEADIESMHKKASVKATPTKSSTMTTTLSTKQENNLKKRRSDNPGKKEFSKSSSSLTVNKPKMPRRNVTSKVKTMIAASASISKCSEDENQENQPVNVKSTTLKKNGNKWDVVLSKIEKSKLEEKLKGDKPKDVKSKVCSMPRMPHSKLHKDVKPFSPNGNAINNVSNTPSRQKENLNHRFKIRKIRNRINGESSVQSSAVTAPVSLSRTSSRNSSVTDISDSLVDISQHSLPAVSMPTDYSKSKKASSPLCSPLSESGVSTVALQSLIVNTKDMKISSLSDATIKSTLKQRQTGSVNSLVENSSAMKAPRKMNFRRTLPKVAPLKDQNRLQTSNGTGPCAVKNNLLKPLPERTSRTTDVASKSAKSKIKQCPQIAKINPLLFRLKYVTNGMESFVILFQRLTADPDVFALPHIKRELGKYKQEWLDMKLKLEEANVSCRRLKEETEMQTLLYDQKLEELRQIHLAQLDRLSELHNQELKTRTAEYEKELKALKDKMRDQELSLQSRFNDNLSQLQREAELKLESILDETKNQVEMLKLENDSWKEKLIKESWRKLEEVETRLKNKIEHMEINYLNQLNEADEEARKREELFLKSMKRKPADKCKSMLVTSESNSEFGKFSSETSLHGTRPDIQNLEEEICSLRIVLDLKHSEIQDLRKQNEKLRKDVQDLPFISHKLDCAQARVEDLNAQLQTKIENEERLLKENRKLLETVQHESEKKKRLTFHNEELMWKLKKSAQVAKTLAVFNSSLQKEELGLDTPHAASKSPKSCRCRLTFNEKKIANKQLKRSCTDADIKLMEFPSDADATPKVLGVVEKSDSVSWVLEIDEPPQAVASRMLRRANSLRSVPAVKKKPAQNQQSLTLPSRNKKSPTGTPDHGDSSETSGEFVKCDVDESKSVDITTVKKETEIENKSVSEEIASIFDFLQDSDFDSDPVVCDDADVFYSNVEGLPSSFSSSSSDCSLELDAYDKESNPQFSWSEVNHARQQQQQNGDEAPAKVVTDSSNSDTDGSESVDSFLTSAPTAGAILNELVNSTNK